MKRLLFTAVLWGAVLLPMAAQAQRGMGFHGSSAPSARAGGGFAARPSGFSARPAGFAGRSSGFGARPMGRVAPAGIRSMPAGRVVTSRGRTFTPGQRSFASRSRFGDRRFGDRRFGDRFHHRFRDRDRFLFGSTCFNSFGTAFSCQNPFLYSSLYPYYPYYDPFFDNYSSQSEPQPVVAEQDNNGNRELASEVQELSDEIQSMRDEERNREERRNSNARPAAQDDGPNATLIFRDGLQLSVKNYAVAGDTIWVLDDHNTRKVPLSKIDIAATQKINEQNGAELRLPH